MTINSQYEAWMKIDRQRDKDRRLVDLEVVSVCPLGGFSGLSDCFRACCRWRVETRGFL
jgi:hypothetical protein